LLLSSGDGSGMRRGVTGDMDHSKSESSVLSKERGLQMRDSDDFTMPMDSRFRGNDGEVEHYPPPMIGSRRTSSPSFRIVSGPAFF
jgi:hypothetical protein